MNRKIKDEYQIMNKGTTNYYKRCGKLNLVVERKSATNHTHNSFFWEDTHIIQTNTTRTYAAGKQEH